MLMKDGLLDEDTLLAEERAQEDMKEKVAKFEAHLESLQIRFARLLAEYTATQQKLKQRISFLEQKLQSTTGSSTDDQTESNRDFESPNSVRLRNKSLSNPEWC